jgi:hypothetical protein
MAFPPPTHPKGERLVFVDGFLRHQVMEVISGNHSAAFYCSRLEKLTVD